MWRPLIGGIQINTELPNGVTPTTLGFAAKDGSGNKGFVVAAHAAPSIGDQIWQPIAGPSANKVGKVTKVSKYSADASWVPYANVDARIYDYDVNTKNVTSYADPSLGQYVYKSGIVTGKTYGKVTKKMTIYNPGVGKNLDNHILHNIGATLETVVLQYMFMLMTVLRLWEFVGGIWNIQFGLFEFCVFSSLWSEI